MKILPLPWFFKHVSDYTVDYIAPLKDEPGWYTRLTWLSGLCMERFLYLPTGCEFRTHAWLSADTHEWLSTDDPRHIALENRRLVTTAQAAANEITHSLKAMRQADAINRRAM